MGGEATIFMLWGSKRHLAALRSPVTCSSKSRSQVSKWLSASFACEPRLSWISTIEDNFWGPRGRVHVWYKHVSLGVLMSAWPNTTDQVDAITRCHHNQRMDHFLHVTPIRTYAHLQIKIKKIRQMSHTPAVVFNHPKRCTCSAQIIRYPLGFFGLVPPVLHPWTSQPHSLKVTPNQTSAF